MKEVRVRVLESVSERDVKVVVSIEGFYERLVSIGRVRR